MATTDARRTASQPPRRPNTNGARKSGRQPRKRRNPILTGIVRFIQWVLVFVLFAIIVAMGLVYYIIIVKMPAEVPDLPSYVPEQRTLIYATDGTLLANLYHENRQVITIDQIPLVLQQATIAVEDRRFYQDKGIDFRGIVRAVWRDVHGGREEGASTLTQQLVRNMHIGGVGSEKTLSRKVKEALYAIKIEREYSKQQILEFYLNEVYYGSGAYGIQAASETYFNEPASKLTLAQAALLAGLPNSPNYDSPYQRPQNALRRRNVVLETMRECNYITEQQYEDTKAMPLGLAFTTSPQGKSRVYHAPYFVDYVVKELTQRFGSDFIQRGGLKVYTTLNLAIQAEADQDLRQGIHDAAYTGATQGALVSMDPQTGYIKAMVGGVDYAKSQFNIAADGRRQPGSSFKPIIYTSAIDSGLITEKSIISDSRISFPSANGWWTPKNDNDAYGPPVTAKEAMAMSINVPAVRVLKLVGPENAIRYAQMMGVHSPLEPYLTLALGASAVTPLEMATVYSVIATDGNRPTPTGIESVTDANNNPIYTWNPDTEVETLPISKDALNQVSDMLRAVVTQGTAAASFYDNNPPDAHGKTGTTQSHLDVWFDGYAKGLVTCVWAGHPSKDASGRPIYGIPMNHEAFGATVCTPIWKKFMVAALPIAVAEEAREKAQRDAANPPPPPPPDAILNGNSADNGGGNGPVNSSTGATDNGDDADDSGAALGSVQPTSTTVTVWIDNDTGQRVAPNSPNSHTEEFATGQEPAFPAKPQLATPPATNTNPTDDTMAPLPVVAQTGDTITVTICTESGDLATQWCPETINKTYKLGQQPTKVCTIHGPPADIH